MQQELSTKGKDLKNKYYIVLGKLVLIMCADKTFYTKLTLIQQFLKNAQPDIDQSEASALHLQFMYSIY